MQRIAAIAVASFTLLACSSGGGDNAKIIQPDVELVQLSGPAEQNYPQGAIEVHYGVRVANRSSEPITLKRIQVQSTSLGGPYRLQSASYYFNREIRPGAFEDVKFWARAFSTGDAFATDALAPVNIRAEMYFQSSAGGFRKVITRLLQQRGSFE